MPKAAVAVALGCAATPPAAVAATSPTAAGGMCTEAGLYTGVGCTCLNSHDAFLALLRLRLLGCLAAGGKVLSYSDNV